MLVAARPGSTISLVPGKLSHTYVVSYYVKRSRTALILDNFGYVSNRRRKCYRMVCLCLVHFLRCKPQFWALGLYLQRRARRAAKFGTATLEDKKALRAKRFGLPVASAGETEKSGNKNGKGSAGKTVAKPAESLSVCRKKMQYASLCRTVDAGFRMTCSKMRALNHLNGKLTYNTRLFQIFSLLDAAR